MRESDFRPSNLSVVNLCAFSEVRTKGLTIEEAKTHWNGVVQALEADVQALARTGTVTVEYPRNIRYKVSAFDGNCSSVIAATRKHKKENQLVPWDVYAEASPFKAERSKAWAALRRIAKAEFDTVKEEGFPEYTISVKLPTQEEEMEDDGAIGDDDGYIRFASMNKYTLKLTFGIEALAFLQWNEEHARECVAVFT